MSEFELKKRALVAECEVYRETLKLELHNFRLYALRTRRKFTSFGAPQPLLLLLGPLMGAFLRRRRGSWLKRLLMTFLSWQFSQRIAPFITGLFSRTRREAKPEAWQPPSRSDAPSP
jgi:hypothetical protein